MKIKHELTHFAQCPHGGEDCYTITVKTDRLLPVEDILAALKEMPQPIYQEDLTRQLAERVRARVKTVGLHSGVETTCVAVG